MENFSEKMNESGYTANYTVHLKKGDNREFDLSTKNGRVEYVKAVKKPRMVFTDNYEAVLLLDGADTISTSDYFMVADYECRMNEFSKNYVDGADAALYDEESCGNRLFINGIEVKTKTAAAITIELAYLLGLDGRRDCQYADEVVSNVKQFISDLCNPEKTPIKDLLKLIDYYFYNDDYTECVTHVLYSSYDSGEKATREFVAERIARKYDLHEIRYDGYLPTTEKFK